MMLLPEFTIHVHGLGYSLVEVHIASYDVQTRLLVCATPTVPGWIELRLALSIQEITHPQRIHPLLWLVPRALFNRFIAHLTFRGFIHDVQQDFEIWEHKRYIQPPALAKGDGPIGKYRTWARQFYSGHAQATLQII